MRKITTKEIKDLVEKHTEDLSRMHYFIWYLSGTERRDRTVFSTIYNFHEEQFEALKKELPCDVFEKVLYGSKIGALGRFLFKANKEYIQNTLRHKVNSLSMVEKSLCSVNKLLLHDGGGF